MLEHLALVGMTYLLVKHFVCDFPSQIQTPWMFLNKGTYGHPGGIVHALIHCAATLPLLLWFNSFMDLGNNASLGGFCLVGEFLIHYHMDWFKMWWNDRKGYKADTHPQFWFWLGIDQMVHGLTYVAILWVWV